MPLATASVTLAALSFAGYPILGGFPVYQALWRNLAVETPLLAALALFGSLGLGVGALRSLAVLVMGVGKETWQINEHWLMAIFLIIGILLIVLLGIFPQWVLPYAATISRTFSQMTSPTLVP
jgi:formate hydrogenlyase subunit 3/multisubunit Na+/H+ antiporter MnhD subunit